MFFYYSRTVNCDRFTTGDGKNDITIRPTAKVQVILGTNGSGKTSLQKVAFSPIPPKPSSFVRPGLWHVKLFDKGRDFDLSAKFGDRDSYSFIVDGEELNKSRNITKQLELTLEYLNYTPAIHDLHTGKLKFTEMTVGQRRDWIAKLSSVDFTYAFNEFKRYTKGMNQSKDYRQRLQVRINEEREKLLPDEDMQKMRAELKELRETLELLMREPKSNVRCLSKEELDHQIAKVIHEIGVITQTEFPPVPDNGQSWEMQLELLKGELNEEQGALNVRGEVVADLEQRLRRVEALMSNDPKELEATQKTLREELDKLPNVSIGLHESLLVKAPEVISALRAAIGHLPGKYVSIEEKNTLQDSVFAKRVKLGKITGLLDDILRQIGHIDNCQAVTCPACSHVFKPGVDPAELDNLKQRVTNGEALQTTISSELNEEEELLHTATQSTQAYIELEQIRHRYQSRHPGLFAYIDQEGGFGLGKALLAKLAIFEREVMYVEEKTKVLARLVNVEAALNAYNQESGDYAEIKQQYETALTQYDACARRVGEVRHERDEVIKKIRSCSEYEAMVQAGETLYQDLRGMLIDYCDDIGDTIIEEMIQKTQKTMHVREQALYENDQTLTIIKDLTNQFAIAQAEELAYTALHEAMSPKTGLIAEQISHQIGSLVKAINSMIQRVWGYPLYLTVGGVDEDGVDYKFPMNVNGKARDDISEGSDSIKTIVNWAFVYVSYYCLNFLQYPLHLDELGRDFDELHRVNLLKLVKEFSDSERFSQIFMINHSLDQISSFPNSEVIIINPDNINYTEPHNQHVEFA